MEEKKKRLILIDGHSLLFRAFHAYPPLTTSKGELINAVYGFTNIVLSVIHELEPSHLAVTFDRDKPTFRHTEYVGYKAQREEMPTELASQQARVEEVVQTLNIPIFAVEGFEADDVIGTLAEQAKKMKKILRRPGSSHRSRSAQAFGSEAQARRDDSLALKSLASESNELDEVVIVTGDMDAMQLVDSDGKVKVRVYVPGRGKKPAMLYDEKEVEQKYEGLQPEQIPDLKGLAGDASDNIPGVRGVGPKTAIGLLLAHKTVEGVYNALSAVPERLGKLLADNHEEAVLSKKLATIARDVPIELKLKACAVHDYDKEKAVGLFQELEFRSLIKKLPNDSFEQAVQEAMF